MRSIALINQKGGVGKTSTAVNLGAALAKVGKRVLLIDLDPQANLTSWLLGPASEGLDETLAEILLGEARVEDLIFHTSVDKLDIIPANLKLCGVEKYLSGEIGAESILRDVLSDAELSPDPRDPSFDLYDYLMIDCPPSVNLLTINAMTAVEEIIVPVQAHVLALNGLANIRKITEKIRKRLNPHLQITGILLAMVNGRTRLSREVEASARSHFGELVYRTTIRDSVRVAECPSHFQPIHEYSPSSVVNGDYSRLAHELISQEEISFSRRQSHLQRGSIPPRYQGRRPTVEDNMSPRFREHV